MLDYKFAQNYTFTGGYTEKSSLTKDLFPKRPSVKRLPVKKEYEKRPP